MSYTCSDCELEADYNLLKQDVGRSCPECDTGEIVFKGYCRDCYDVMIISDTSETHRCSTCKTGHTFETILREPH